MEKQGVKYIPKERLIKLLEELPDNSFVAVNRVGNLMVVDDAFEYIGFIDFLLEVKIQ